MAKIRGVKPELWTDENFVELSPFARLLWIGMWNHACDNGHLQDKSKQIKMRILPTDDVNCAGLLREIEDQGLIERADGWITIPNLTHHQKPHKRWYVVCEKPDCEHPEGTSYGYQKADPKPESTVEQPLVNDEIAFDNGGSTADVDCDVDVDGELMVNKSGVEDAQPPSRSLALVNDDRDDVDHLCHLLAEAIETTGSKKPAITVKWRNEARLMLDRDGRSEAEVEACIRWLFSSNHPDALWWRAGRIQSMPKLREKFDAMRLQAQSAPRGNRQQETDGLFERAAARMGVTGGGL